MGWKKYRVWISAKEIETKWQLRKSRDFQEFQAWNLEGSLYSLACFLFNNNKKDTDLVKSLVEMLPLLVISPKTCFQFENENMLH